MRRVMLFAAALVLALPGASATAQSAALRAGAAKADITPSGTMLATGQNYGSVHDPLFARALVLGNGRDKVVLATADISGLPNGNDLTDSIGRALNIPRQNIFLSATHNHNSPTVGADTPGAMMGERSPYYAVLKAGLLKAIRDADARLQPARIGFGTGKAYVNTNRDEKIGAGYHMGYVPDGPSDKTVAVVTVTTPTGAPIAVYANYAVHGVVMFRVKSKDGRVQITSDLPGWTSNYVEERLGGGSVALWTSGAAGDQNPLFQALYNQDHPDVYDTGPAGWAILDVQARRLGQEIVRVAKATTNTAGTASLWGAQTSVTCPGRQRAEPAAPGTPTGGYLAPAEVRMIDGDPVTVPLHLLMINDIALAGVSAEVFTEIGEQVKRESIFDRTMMVTLLPNRIGYIPTDKAFLLPAEKALTNRLKPGCAEPAIVNAFKGLMTRYVQATGR